MSIAFNQIPGDIRVPLFAAEINGGPPSYSSISRMLLIGRADEDVLEPLKLVNAGSADPSTLCGYGSMLADMLLHARQVNRLGEIYVIATPEGEDADEAVGSVTFAGTARARGTFRLFIAGEPYSCAVNPGDTAATIAGKFRAAVGRGYRKFGCDMGAPVRANVDGTNPAKINLTARFPGAEGNEIRLDKTIGGDYQRVPGITVTIVPMADGAGGGAIEAALAAIAAEPFDWIAGPFSGSTSLDAVRDFMRTRWDPLTSLDGHYVCAREGTLSGLTAYGAARNDPHVTILGTHNAPNPSWIWASLLCGQIAFSKNLGRSLSTAVEIARPMQTLLLPGVLPPADATSIFTPTERDSLLRNGISTFTFGADGEARCDRIITTYRTNDAQLLDTTFLDIEAVCIAAYVKRYFRNALLGRYPRHVMRDDNPNGVQGVVTPNQAIACVIHAYEELAGACIVRQEEEFSTYLRVEFDYTRDRADFYLPVAKSGALRIFAVNLTLFSDLTPAAAQL